jgi:hypothetical protein
MTKLSGSIQRAREPRNRDVEVSREEHRVTVHERFWMYHGRMLTGLPDLCHEGKALSLERFTAYRCEYAAVNTLQFQTLKETLCEDRRS